MDSPDLKQIFDAEKVLNLSKLSEYSADDVSKERVEIVRHNHPDQAKSPDEKAQKEKLLREANNAEQLLLALFTEEGVKYRKPLKAGDLNSARNNASPAPQSPQTSTANASSEVARTSQSTTSSYPVNRSGPGFKLVWFLENVLDIIRIVVGNIIIAFIATLVIQSIMTQMAMPGIGLVPIAALALCTMNAIKGIKDL